MISSYLLLQARTSKISVPRTSEFPSAQDPLPCTEVDGNLDVLRVFAIYLGSEIHLAVIFQVEV